MGHLSRHEGSRIHYFARPPAPHHSHREHPGEFQSLKGPRGEQETGGYFPTTVIALADPGQPHHQLQRVYSALQFTKSFNAFLGLDSHKDLVRPLLERQNNAEVEGVASGARQPAFELVSVASQLWD